MRVQLTARFSPSLFRGIVRRAAQTNLLSLFFQVAVVLVLHFSAGLWFLREFDASSLSLETCP